MITCYTCTMKTCEERGAKERKSKLRTEYHKVYSPFLSSQRKTFRGFRHCLFYFVKPRMIFLRLHNISGVREFLVWVTGIHRVAMSNTAVCCRQYFS